MLNQDFLQGEISPKSSVSSGSGQRQVTANCLMEQLSREAVCLARPRPAGSIMSSKTKPREVAAGHHDNP